MIQTRRSLLIVVLGPADRDRSLDVVPVSLQDVLEVFLGISVRLIRIQREFLFVLAGIRADDRDRLRMVHLYISHEFYLYYYN